MCQELTKWSLACLVVTAVVCALSASVDVAAKVTPEPTQPDASAETRDVDIIDLTLILDDCNDTFRTEMSYIESLNKSGSFPDEDDKTAKCFVRCLLEKSGVVSEDGVFDKQRAPAFFASERVVSTEGDFRESTDVCSNRNETCFCERAYQYVKCVVKTELNKYDTQSTAH